MCDKHWMDKFTHLKSTWNQIIDFGFWLLVGEGCYFHLCACSFSENPKLTFGMVPRKIRISKSLDCWVTLWKVEDRVTFVTSCSQCTSVLPRCKLHCTMQNITLHFSVQSTVLAVRLVENVSTFFQPTCSALQAFSSTSQLPLQLMLHQKHIFWQS